jgi:hypothetical protein
LIRSIKLQNGWHSGVEIALRKINLFYTVIFPAAENKMKGRNWIVVDSFSYLLTFKSKWVTGEKIELLFLG